MSDQFRGIGSEGGRRGADPWASWRQTPRLVELLAHYAALRTPDRSIWQKRLSEMEGIDPKELSRIHEELIAFDWIEQNPSRASASPGIVLAGIYLGPVQVIQHFRFFVYAGSASLRRFKR